jgi:hypothetical protein
LRTYTDASLNLKSSITYVDLSVNALRTYADSSLNLKSSITYVDSSLNALRTYIDSSLNLKSSIEYVDSSVNILRSYADSSLNLKSSISYVDASLNLKAPIASPTFTGTAIIPTANITILNAIGDSSLNGNVTIGRDLTIHGRLNVQNYTNQNIINTTTTNYQLIISEDLSLNGRLVASGDVSLNSDLYIKNVNGNVQSVLNDLINRTTNITTDANNEIVISSNIIPSSANTISLGSATMPFNSLYINTNTLYFTSGNTQASLSYNREKKSLDITSDNVTTTTVDITYVDASLNLKSSIQYVDSSLNALRSYADSSLNLKSSITYVDSSLNSLRTYIDSSLNLKSSITYVDSSLNALRTYTDSSLNLKSSITYVDSSLNILRTYTDSSLNLKSSIEYVDSSLNTLRTYTDSSLNLKATIASPTFTGEATIPTANITTLNTIGDSSMNGNVIIGKDLSLNGSLYVVGDSSFNGNLYIAGTLTAANYAANSIPSSAIIGGVSSSNSSGDFTTNGNLFVKYDSSMNGNVVIGKDLTINGRLNVQANTIPANAIIGGVSTSSSAGDFTANGNLTATGTITGNIVNTASTTSTTNDTWLLTNIMNAPPGVVFGNVVSTSTYIYIPWTYPSQTNIGLVSTYVPVISAVNANVYGNTSVGSFSNNVLTNQTGNQYINNYSISSNPNSYTSLNNSPITGIILSKSAIAGTSGSTDLTPNTVCRVPFPQDNGNSYTGTNYRNAFVYYNSSITSLISSPNPTFTLYYTNNKSTYNSSLVNFSIFLSTGTPSAPGTPSQTSNTSSSITISYTAPTAGDSNNPTIATPITNYKVTYQSTANSFRYGGFVSQSSNVETGNTSTTPTISSLYPDTTYTIFVQARNGDNASYGNVSANLTTAVTSSISPSISGGFSTTLTFSPTNYSAKLISTSSSISNLILSNSSLTSGTNTFAVHELSNRGNLGNSTPVSLSLAVSGARTIAGPSVSVNNFPATNITGNTTNDLTIGTIATTDSYSATGSTGFYLQGSGTVTLGSTIFTPSNSQYTVTLTRTGATTQPRTYSFYYDTAGANPIVGSVTINKLNTTANTTTRQVSGVWVVYGTPTLDVSCSDLSNVGHYFYNNSQLLAYSSTTSGIISTSETTLTNVSAGITSGEITGNLTITKSALSYNTNSTFHIAIGVRATAYNIQNNTGYRDSTSIAAIVDPASQTLVYSTLQQSIGGSNLSSATAGYRIYSGVSSGSYEYRPDSLYSYNSSTYVNTAYGNSWDITSTNNSGIDATYELQIANGYFQTSISSTNGYKNYTSYYYGTSLNTVNYSSISTSGYRYATFAWRLTSVTGTGYNGIRFSFVNNSTTYFDSNSAYANSGNTKKIQLYYRVEDPTSSIPNLSKLSTAWIDGNYTPNTVNSSNYNTEGQSGLNTFSGSTNTIFNVILPYTINSTTVSVNPIIYCRIGLPMDVAYQFQYITATMTSS